MGCCGGVGMWVRTRNKLLSPTEVSCQQLISGWFAFEISSHGDDNMISLSWAYIMPLASLTKKYNSEECYVFWKNKQNNPCCRKTLKPWNQCSPYFASNLPDQELQNFSKWESIAVTLGLNSWIWFAKSFWVLEVLCLDSFWGLLMELSLRNWFPAIVSC